jgi:hypothetical protein
VDITSNTFYKCTATLQTHCILTPLYSQYTLIHVSAKGPRSGSTDTFCEQGQQNTCPDVNIRLKGNVLCYVATRWNLRVLGLWCLTSIPFLKMLLDKHMISMQWMRSIAFTLICLSCTYILLDTVSDKKTVLIALNRWIQRPQSQPYCHCHWLLYSSLMNILLEI